mmetsp:Transcript_61798/g.148707  ORF Transcript_61798/g.148707 Transcript_61798/m.148707 type:complete len:251 (-) Transcript_61798:23-775(-)
MPVGGDERRGRDGHSPRPPPPVVALVGGEGGIVDGLEAWYKPFRKSLNLSELSLGAEGWRLWVVIVRFRDTFKVLLLSRGVLESSKFNKRSELPVVKLLPSRLLCSLHLVHLHQTPRSVLPPSCVQPLVVHGREDSELVTEKSRGDVPKVADGVGDAGLLLAGLIPLLQEVIAHALPRDQANGGGHQILNRRSVFEIVARTGIEAQLHVGECEVPQVVLGGHRVAPEEVFEVASLICTKRCESKRRRVRR